jgi:hypothetical protein
MSVGTWTRLSTVPVRSLYRRPQSRYRKRRKPCTVRSSRSVIDDDWQCGQFIMALLISQNGSENLSINAFLSKLPRDLTEPSVEQPCPDHPDADNAVTASALRNHLESDVMHDALRVDVLAALQATRQGQAAPLFFFQGINNAF